MPKIFEGSPSFGSKRVKEEVANVLRGSGRVPRTGGASEQFGTPKRRTPGEDANGEPTELDLS